MRLTLNGFDPIDPGQPLATVDDVEGSYTIPFICSPAKLDLTVSSNNAETHSIQVSLSSNGKSVTEQRLPAQLCQIRLSDLICGDYLLEANALDAKGQTLETARWTPISIGTVIAAIGDSLTEGYFGQSFWRDDLNLRAEHFPNGCVSHDRRNYPQFAPTSAQHLPEVNCFNSWTTLLNDLLTNTWQRPVFIANEGWGGISTKGVLDMIRHDENWQQRISLLQPDTWLIHLGVNDERGLVDPQDFEDNLKEIASTIIQGVPAQMALG